MDMRKLLVSLPLLFAASLLSFAQEPRKPDVPTLAAQEADRLESALELESWQTFYVDSILNHDYAAMTAELEQLQSAKVGNTSVYIQVQDKWLDRIDVAYRKIFNDAQWTKYLKQGAAKAQKARDKRRAAAEGE